MLEDLKNKLEFLKTESAKIKKSMDLADKVSEIEKLELITNDPDFWNKPQSETKKIFEELRMLKEDTEVMLSLEMKIEEAVELFVMAEGDKDLVDEVMAEVSELLLNIEEMLSKLEMKKMLGGRDDKNNAIVSINAGAGGTESCDWAQMLYRMYTLWANKKDFSMDVVDILAGEEAGIKSITIIVKGTFAYGYMKAERGVHRLVRISPFDSSSRRHTSFVSVDVIPEIVDDSEIEVNEADLRIDTYRSSGAGGQHVNTTDSAVRITHIPTGIVVQCQNERSQIKNRLTSMKLLKAKLYEVKLKEEEAKKSQEYGNKKEIAWGSQIRSYVLHPYSMIKDHRTNYETSNVNAVLDGDIDTFIEKYLKEF